METQWQKNMKRGCRLVPQNIFIRNEENSYLATCDVSVLGCYIYLLLADALFLAAVGSDDPCRPVLFAGVLPFSVAN